MNPWPNFELTRLMEFFNVILRKMYETCFNMMNDNKIERCIATITHALEKWHLNRHMPKQTNDMCAQQGLGSAWASVQSDHSL